MSTLYQLSSLKSYFFYDVYIHWRLKQLLEPSLRETMCNLVQLIPTKVG